MFGPPASSAPKSSMSHEKLCPVHRGIIAMSGRAAYIRLTTNPGGPGLAFDTNNRAGVKALAQGGEQLLHRSCRAGNDGSRGNLIQRNQHKQSLRHARMRNLQSRRADFEIAKEQNVQIQRARPIHERRRPVPAKLLFNGQQTVEQLPRLQLRLQFDYRIHEAGLRGKSHRSGGVKRGPLRHPPQRFQAPRRRRQSRLRRARPTG